MSSSPESHSTSSERSLRSPRKRKREEHDSESDSDSGTKLSLATSQAISHAERRRQKKREKQETYAKDGTKPQTKSVNAVTQHAPHRQNSVWVGNLSFKTTPEALEAFFEGVGEITRINMPMRLGAGAGKSENRGFAYVDFSTAEAKVAAIAKSEEPLVGRRLLIKDGSNFAGRPDPPNTTTTAPKPSSSSLSSSSTGHTKSAQKILRAQKQPPAPTLFFGNLGFETTEEAIRGLLEAHRARPHKKARVEDGDGDGEGTSEKEKEKEMWIRKVRMGTFEDSGLCKGFAFVDFTSVEHATAALTHPKNHRLNGRHLVVEYASADAVRRGGGGDKRKSKPTVVPRTIPTMKREQAAKVDDQRKDSVKDRTHARSRPRPGAALAHAQRESAAIIPVQNQKITF